MKGKKFRVLVIALIVLISIGTALLLRRLFSQKGFNQVVDKVVVAERAEKKYAKLTEENARGGEIGRITQTTVVNQKTGTAPFDENDNPGNDSSESNGIVRSFDQIIWTLDIAMDLKDASSGKNGLGGVIQLEANLPTNCSNHIIWDLDSMDWAEDATISDDGTNFTANYSLDSNFVTVPGKKTVVLVAQVLNAENGLQFKPTFKTKLYGNNDEETVTVTTDSSIIVSASPKYNVQLNRNSNFSKKTTVNYGSGDVVGRMYGYSFALQMHNGENDIDRSKGLRGIEFPDGEISFDIDMTFAKSDLESLEIEDITSQCTPIIWNYSNNSGTNGYIENRTMNFGAYCEANVSIPWGINNGDRENSVYDSGVLNITQNGNKLTVKVSDYKIDGNFPHYHAFYTEGVSAPIWEENVGCFSIGYIQVFVPDNSASTTENNNYYLTLRDSNFKASSASGITVTNQVITNDDSDTVNQTIYSPVAFSHSLHFVDSNISSTNYAGDGKVTVGQEVILSSSFRKSANSIDDVLSAIKFVKYDGSAFEPIPYNMETGEKFGTNISGENAMQFRCWYVTKPDGSNWLSTEEQRDAQIEDMNLYDNIEDIPSGYLCIGMYFESVSGKLDLSENNLYIPLRTKIDATIGNTYAFMQRTKMWTTDIDRNEYTITKNNPTTWPGDPWDSGDFNYIKTEYDENGTMLPGSHNGGWQNGQTVLVVGSNLTISKKAIDEETGETKVNYDLGKGENEVTFKIEPTLQNERSFVRISKIKLKIEDKLPKGLTYIQGSCNYIEPEILNNEDGTTTLIWYKENCSTGKTIDAITYKAGISNEADNGSQFETSVLVSEAIGNDEQTKIGTIDENYRIAKTSISIINMSVNEANIVTYDIDNSTNDTVIENDGEIKYSLTVTNTYEKDGGEFQLIDVLPYNGDELGSSYNGTITVEKIIMNQVDTETGSSVPLSVSAYKTTDKEIRDGLTIKNAFTENRDWVRISSDEMINQSLTGIAIKGKLAKRNIVEIELIVKTDGNNPKDIYNNSVVLLTNIETKNKQSASTEVIYRELTGTVWKDVNEDGIMNTEEEKVSGAILTLLNEDGTSAKNIYREDMDPVLTDENGNYKLENMSKGTYKVVVSEPDMEKVTIKDIGDDETLNSKFNNNNETDIIEDLNESNQSVVIYENINAGIIYKESAGVVVHHYEVDTIQKIKLTNGNDAADNAYTGRVADKYNTTDEKDKAEYYRLLEDRLPINASGKMCSDQTVVTYYYMPQGWIELVYEDYETSDDLINSKFEIYKDEDCTQLVQELEMRLDGKAISGLLDVGTYYVKVTKNETILNRENVYIKEVNIVSAGEVRHVEFKDSLLGYVENYSQTARDNIRDNAIIGTVSLVSVDRENSKYWDNHATEPSQGEATLAGAVYGLYAKEAIVSPETGEVVYTAGALVETKTTDSDGKVTWSGIRPGKYCVREILPCEGYYADTEEHAADLFLYHTCNIKIVKEKCLRKRFLEK